MSRPKFLPENFTLALIAAVAAASVLPCRGAAKRLVRFHYRIRHFDIVFSYGRDLDGLDDLVAM